MHGRAYTEEKDMSLIKDYIEKGGGNFLSVKNCAVGSTVTINTVSLDEETYDKPRIVIAGIFDKTGEECNVSLGIQNVKRVAEMLGEDESKWIGKQIQCLTHADYPGLGTKGLLWGAVGSVAPAADTGKAEVSAVVSQIMEAKPELTVEAIVKLVNEQTEKSGGLLTPIAVAHLVAKNLGVELKK